MFEEGIELCGDCGLCVFCCQDNANAEGCECGEVLEKESHTDADGDRKCDFCDHQIKSTDTEPGTNDPSQDVDSGENDKNLIWLWILIIIIVSMMFGFVIYWFILKKKDENEKKE